MKKFLLLAFSSLILTILFVVAFQYIMILRSQKGALQVTSSPDSKVYLNGNYIGQTPLCKCDNSDMLKVGDYTIRLVPQKDGLSEFQEKITVSASVLTVVDRKFAKDSLSEGSVISLSPLADKNKSELVVVSLPEGSSVRLDSNDIGKTPVSYANPTESDHALKISKAGYKDKIVRIRTLMGYKLTVVAYLAADDKLNDNVASASATQSTETVTPTPSSGKTVLILDTPTGFLRVHDTVGGTETGRVNPGETYQLVDEQDGWLQIKLKDGTAGWVSNQYAKKQ